ncbi:NUDIX domain-containing protein [Devosia sp. XK-2]|uniref:NUDIX domain-containing protein n=1 Tax=Devosia sp. XK-2 TaxID=3126689 RepID=UPI0030CDFCB2
MTERITIVGAKLLAKNWGTLSNVTLDYRHKNGTLQRLEREVYDHGSAAAMLLHDRDRNSVLLVRQFRLPPLLNGDQPDLLEVCAGLLDGDAPAEAAAREALEETGHEPADISHVCDIYTCPGSLTEKVSLFIARYGADTLRHAGGGLEHEGEEIELVELGFDEAMAMTRDGRIVDAKTIILLQHLALQRLG